MSLHSETRECDAVTGWRTICVCGWEGKWHPASTGVDRCHAEYRTHVEEALGVDAYYETSVACSNCGSEHNQDIVVGTTVSAAMCSRCGIAMLNPNNDAWDESRANRKMWGF
jgi:hypothetical protein